MFDGSTLWLFFCASVVLLAVPGPAVIFVVTRSVDHGRSAGLVTVLGIELGTMFYAVAAVVGLTGLIAASEIGFTVVKFAGAAYLIYLGVRKFVVADEREPHPQRPAGMTAWRRLFLSGLVVQLLNPKAAMFFLAFLPQFVDPSRGGIAAQMLILGTLFTLLAMLSDTGYVLLAGTLGRWLRANSRRARRRLAHLTGGIYIGLGVSAAFTSSPQVSASR